MAGLEVLRWKTNGQRVKDSHAFRADLGTGPAYERRAICGKVKRAFYDVNSQLTWEVKRLTCPKCRELVKFHGLKLDAKGRLIPKEKGA